MQLPENFSFNQQNLQDYVDCTRRFYLRHIQKLEWPAIESEPVREQESLLQLGQQFHLMVQQNFAGVPAEAITDSTGDPELLFWWQEFNALKINYLPGLKYCEVLYSVPFASYRLVAKFDLLIIEAEKKATIYDWKTSQHPPKRTTLQSRLQTKVYPLVLSLVSASSKVMSAIDAEKIQMIYWYPDPLISPIQFDYSNSQMQEDSSYIAGLINEISNRPIDSFEKTSQESRCKFCRYRSLCERGLQAGDISKSEESIDTNDTIFDIDFDQISPAD